MAADGAGDELDQEQDAFRQAVPPKSRAELRALVRTAQEPQPHQAAPDGRPDLIPDDDADTGEEVPLSPKSPRAPFPALNSAQSARVTHALILAAERLAGIPIAHSLTRSPDMPGLVARQSLGNAVRLSDVTPERVRWLWPGRIPVGKITVLDGDPGLGKSTLLCEVAARITRGDPLPGGEPAAPRGVLLLSAEDDLLDTIRPRIDAAGGDPDRIGTLLAVPDRTETGRPFSIPGDLPILDAVVERLDAALVIVDPLVAYLRPGVSANRDQDVRRALAALKASAERTGAAIVVVRHLNKSAQTNPLYRGLGSIGIIGAARCGLLLAADPDDADRRILAVSKGNLALPPAALAFRLDDVPGADVARVVWEGESPWTAAELLGRQAGEEGDEPRSAVDDARAWLREALAAGPRPASDLRRESAARGIGLSTLYAARKAEGIATAKEHIARGRWLWMLQSSSNEREDAVPPGS